MPGLLTQIGSNGVPWTRQTFSLHEPERSLLTDDSWNVFIVFCSPRHMSTGRLVGRAIGLPPPSPPPPPFDAALEEEGTAIRPPRPGPAAAVANRAFWRWGLR